MGWEEEKYLDGAANLICIKITVVSLFLKVKSVSKLCINEVNPKGRPIFII